MIGVILESPEEWPAKTVVVWYCDSMTLAVSLASASPMVMTGQLIADTTVGEPRPCGPAS